MARSPEKTVLPYGSWPSPITADLIAKSSVSLHEVRANESTRAVYWLESRPQEQGRFTIVEHDGTASREVLPSNHSAHGKVYEIGGGSFEVSKKGRIVFADENDSEVYWLDPRTRETTLILKSHPLVYYADFSIHPEEETWILAIKEDSRDATPETQAYGVRNALVAINADSGTEHLLAEGDDFYAYPRFSHDGSRICWLQWTHPDMPWTGAVLYVAKWDAGRITEVKRVAGRWKEESVSQPSWSPDGTLFFASDRSGYWQLHAYTEANAGVRSPKFEGLEESEFAIADWRLTSSSYVVLDQDTIIASVVDYATSNIVLLDAKTGSYRDLKLPYVDLAMAMTGLFRITDDTVAILGSTRTSAKQVAIVSNLRSRNPGIDVLKSSMQVDFDASFISEATHLKVKRTLRAGHLHVFFFSPRHAEVRGPPDAKPPGLVYVHGGPNGCSSPALDLTVQFWTTRGFALCVVNYSGSTGFGRAYREELTGYWGLYDVQDASDAATFIKAQGLVDPSAVGIYGGSAGGYCTLSAIHMFPDVFAAAVSSYGISDVRALQADSYKFESHDVERLILSSAASNGGDNETEGAEAVETRRAALLRARSPRFFARKIKTPLLILQGTTDKMVPPEQARLMAEEMRRNRRSVRVVEFEGEGHGWLREDTILRAYQEQEAWWKTHLCVT